MTTIKKADQHVLNCKFEGSGAAGGVLGWVCVTSGTPGTWKSFGAIEA